MSSYFLKNKADTNTGVKIVNKIPELIITNSGPDDAVTNEQNTTNICLSKREEIDQIPATSIANAGEFEGDFVVEINGEVIPLIFDQNTLPLYFDEANTNGKGVAFVKN